MSESGFQQQRRQAEKTISTQATESRINLNEAKYIPQAGQTMEQARQVGVLQSGYAANVQMYSELCETYRTTQHRTITPCTVEALPAEPVQAPKESNKEKRNKSKRLKKYQEEYPDMTMEQMEKMEKAGEVFKGKSNSISSRLTDIERAGADARVLNILAKGYKAKKNGKPINEEEAKNKAYDDELIEAFISKDDVRKKPFLDKITKRVLDFRINDSIMNEKYILDHSVEFKQYIQELGYIENLMKSETSYFQNLPKIVYDKLIRLKTLQGVYSQYVDYVLMSNGIQQDGRAVSAERKAAFGPLAVEMKSVVEAQKQRYEQEEAAYLGEYTKALTEETVRAVANVHATEMNGELGTTFDYLEKVDSPKVKLPIAEALRREMMKNIVKSDAGNTPSEMLTNLELRSSSVASTIAAEYRGTVFNPITESKKEMYRTLHRNGFPLELVAQDVDIKFIGTGNYYDNEPLTVLAKKELEMYSPVILSEKSLTYITSVYNAIKDAKVFNGNPTDCIAYIVQDIVNRNVSNYSPVSCDEELGEDMQQVGSVASKVSVNLMRAMSAVVGHNNSDALPETFRELTGIFTSLVSEVTERVTKNINGGAGADAGAAAGAAAGNAE